MGGKVDIEVKKENDGSKVEIVIDDDGPGIREDKIQEMFEPYRQGEQHSDKTNSTFRGAGLGLSIAKHVITEHWGEITMSNRKAANGGIAGLRISVVLPLNKQNDSRKQSV